MVARPLNIVFCGRYGSNVHVRARDTRSWHCPWVKIDPGSVVCYTVRMTLRFDPPENATNAEKCPGPGWISCGWQMFDKWRDGRGYREIARDLGCSAGNLTLWKQGRVPLKVYLEKLEKMADIAPIAWQYWVCLDPTKAAATSDEPTAADPPPSGSRTIEGKIGATIDELRVGVARLNDLLGKGKLSPGQIAQLEGKRISALTAIARLEERGTLEEHPEFDGFLDLVMLALDETLQHFGVNPSGSRTVFADKIERIEAERAKKNAA